jgi:sortase A
MTFSGVLQYRLYALILLLCAWLAAGLLVFNNRDASLIPRVTSHQELPTRAMFAPVHLRIPAINLDAPILPVGLTEKGAMEVPGGIGDVGWFEPGPVPGQTGSVVLAGHLDTVFGTRAVFGNLHKLRAGDEIGVITASGQTMIYTVRETEIYRYNDAPIERIFASMSGQYLNLITCNGTWNAMRYDKRLVVYAELNRVITQKVDNLR